MFNLIADHNFAIYYIVSNDVQEYKTLFFNLEKVKIS